MLMHFGRALALAAMGGAATYACWFALTIFVWGPFWRQLNRYGMYVHDIDGTYLVAFGPIVVALVFLATALIDALIERRRLDNGQSPPADRWRILFFTLFPAAVIGLLINAPYGDAWRFPLSEAAVALVGFALGFFWVRSRRGTMPAT